METWGNTEYDLQTCGKEGERCYGTAKRACRSLASWWGKSLPCDDEAAGLRVDGHTGTETRPRLLREAVQLEESSAMGESLTERRRVNEEGQVRL